MCRNAIPGQHTHTNIYVYYAYTQRDKQTNTYTRTQTRHRIDRRASQADLKGQRLKCSSGDVPLIAKTDPYRVRLSVCPSACLVLSLSPSLKMCLAIVQSQARSIFPTSPFYTSIVVIVAASDVNLRDAPVCHPA